MADHTPGPWKDEGDVSYITAPDGAPVAAVFIQDRPLDEAEANAKLIAAAPDLLAACEAYMASKGHDVGVLFQIDAAIKQAKGEA